MDNEANVIGARPGDAERPRESGVAALGRGGRMSRQRKTAAVLRLLRGEDLETVSRELGVTAAALGRGVNEPLALIFLQPNPWAGSFVSREATQGDFYSARRSSLRLRSPRQHAAKL